LASTKIPLCFATRAISNYCLHLFGSVALGKFFYANSNCNFAELPSVIDPLKTNYYYGLYHLTSSEIEAHLIFVGILAFGVCVVLVLWDYFLLKFHVNRYLN